MDCANLIKSARAAGLKVTATGDRLIVRGPRREAALAQRLIRNKDAVLAILNDQRVPLAGPDAQWSTADQELITWFRDHQDVLPQESFRLRPGETVSDPAAYYGVLTREIGYGPAGTRTRNRALQDDLDQLRAMCVG